MVFATSYEPTNRYGVGTRRNAFGRRLAIVVALMTSDLLCFVVADAVQHFFGTNIALVSFRGPASSAHNAAIDLLAIIAVVFVLARYIVGDYSRRRLFWDGARSTTGALAICGGVNVAAELLAGVRGLASTFLVWFVLFFLLPSTRQAMRYLLGRLGLWHLPTAMIGTGETAEEVYPVLVRQLSLGLDVRWIVPERPEKHLPKSLAGLKALIAPPENLVETLVSLKCCQVILAPDDPLNSSEIIDELIGADIAVALVPSLRRLPLFGLSTSYFFGKDLLLLQVRNNLARLPQRILKRSIDLVGSALLLLVLSPVFAILALLIKAHDGGPVFFVQTRVGRGRRDFGCWKFRTMVVDAESAMERWEYENPTLLASYREGNFKLVNDPRVTKIGAWLRRKSLDELPQLINVLLGHMSLAGPRPLLRRELPDYGVVITLYERVRPGITGLWQISGRSHTTFAERVSYDEWYIKNWTVWYDVVILLQTMWVLARNKDAY
jgi:Undecaprenyl-phosphate galactose phosphotransferase WbaP